MLVDGCKPVMCFHDGFWLMDRFYQELVIDDKSRDFTNSLTEFCRSYQEGLAGRYEFTLAMTDNFNNETFIKTCLDYIDSHPNVNRWYDPFSAYPKLSNETLC